MASVAVPVLPKPADPADRGHQLVEAAYDLLAEEGLEVEVIDLRTIAPLDTATVLASARKTGRVLVAHEDNIFGGFGGEVAALIAEEAFEKLDAPVMRLGGKNVPIGHSPVLEEAALPQLRDIEAKLRALLEY